MPGFPSIDDPTPSMEEQFGEIDMSVDERRYNEREIYAYGRYINCQILNWQDGPPPQFIICHPLHADYREEFIATQGMGTWMRIDLREVLARLSRSTSTDAVAERVVAWLIERKGLGDGSGPYWYVENEDDGWHWWTPDASQAKRFATKADAEAFPAYQMIASDPDISVTEHVFLSPACPSLQGGAEPDATPYAWAQWVRVTDKNGAVMRREMLSATLPLIYGDNEQKVEPISDPVPLYTHSLGETETGERFTTGTIVQHWQIGIPLTPLQGGSWVKYQDHEAALTSLRAERDEWESTAHQLGRDAVKAESSLAAEKLKVEERDAIIAECATACGALVSPETSIEFKRLLPGEISAKIARTKTESEQRVAALVGALTETLAWIKKWDPLFVEDDRWPATRARIDAALATEA